MFKSKAFKLLFGLGVLALMALSPVLWAICPMDPEILCGMKCQTYWCVSGGAAGTGCIQVYASPGYNGGCMGGFYHCSCARPGGG